MGMTTNTRSHNASVTNLAMGRVVTDGAAAVPVTFNCGFVPRYIKWVNLTSFAMTEYYDTMDGTVAAAASLGTVAAGTRAVGAGGTGIQVGTPALLSAGQFTVPAALIPASSTFVWQAMG